MPTSMRAALRDRAGPAALALVVALVVVVTVAFGFTLGTAALMLGGALAATLLDAAVAAGRLHRQTLRALVGVVVIAAGFTLASEGGWTSNAVVFVALPFGLGGAWTVFDALVSRRRGVVEVDGSVGGVPDVPALVANRDTVGRVYAVLEAADRPLAVEEVADVAGLDPEWTRRVLALLDAWGVVDAVEDRYAAGDLAGPPSTATLVVRGTATRLLQPFRLAAGYS